MSRNFWNEYTDFLWGKDRMMQLSPCSIPFSKSVNVIYQPTHVSGPYQVVLIGVQSVDLPGSLGLEETWVTVREAISLFAPSNLFNPPSPCISPGDPTSWLMEESCFGPSFLFFSLFQFKDALLTYLSEDWSWIKCSLPLKIPCNTTAACEVHSPNIRSCHLGVMKCIYMHTKIRLHFSLDCNE